MKKYLYLFATSALFASLLSCSKETPVNYEIPEVSIVNLSGENSAAQSDTVFLKAGISSSSESSFSWSVGGVTQNTTDSVFLFSSSETGEHTVTLTCVNKGGEGKATINIEVYGKYKHGTFVLNEGNMTTENGSLIFISPKGRITDSVYWRTNGSFPGNVCQDLFIAGGKMYIVSQNGASMGGDGFLVVADAETMKKEAAYSTELASLSWPTHVAVVGTNIYIRDNYGVHLFNSVSKSLNLIPGTSAAAKNRSAVAGGKVFVPAGKNIFVIQGNAVIHTIEMPGSVSGVVKADKNSLYVSCTTNPAQIVKVNAADYSFVKTNTLPADARVGAGWGATPGISAKGDTIYFSNASTKIYRHLFGSNSTDYMTDVKDHIPNAGIVYNNLAVHPVTGEVYFNTIKAYGWDFLINDISVFDFAGQTPVLKADYQNFTHFPAGIFFTYDFE